MQMNQYNQADDKREQTSQFGFSGGDAWVSICTAARPPTPPRPSACGQALGPVNAAATSAPPSASAKKVGCIDANMVLWRKFDTGRQ